MPTWDPAQYLTYVEERGRPFVDLLARVGAASPATVLDLGCGPGNMTRLLAERWPDAAVMGVDSSAEMIARARADHPALSWELGDLRDWSGTADVVISNAALQWIPDHLELVPALAARAGEWFAFQVPGSSGSPSHALAAELAASGTYAAHTARAERLESYDPADYLDVLIGDFEVDAWETTYLHVLRGEDAVLDWVSGTGLRPLLQALPEELRHRFVEELRPRLRAAYPVRAGRVVLPFRRIFVVARRR